MYKILLAAVASGLQIFYDPATHLMTVSKSPPICPKIDGDPTVYNLADYKCYDLFLAGVSSQTIVIDNDSDGKPEQIYQKGDRRWIRVK